MFQNEIREFVIQFSGGWQVAIIVLALPVMYVVAKAACFATIGALGMLGVKS